MDMTTREQDVLLTIIEHYIETAQPVASRTVAKRSGLGLSPATMRSVMADLTDKGLLEQPHTSAGRVPTQEAFRYYVDRLLDLVPASRKRRERLEATLETKLGTDEADVSELLRRASHLLAENAHQVSMVVAPSYGAVRLKQLDFVQLKPDLVLAILVLFGGIVQQKLIHLEEGVTPDELVKYSNFVAEKFAGRTLAEIRASLVQEMSHEFRKLERKALAMADKAFAREQDQKVFVDGAANLLAQPAFGDEAALRDILSLLSERSKLVDILDKVMHGGPVSINVGASLAQTPLTGTAADVSLVSSPYALQGQPMGVVGVLGPMNMDYATVVPTVEIVAAIITNMLHKRF